MLSLILIFNFCFSFFSATSVKYNGKGVYVLNYSVEQSRGRGLISVLPDDSVFFNRGYGLEKVIGFSDSDENGVATRKPMVSNYYFIDFKLRRTIEIKNLSLSRKAAYIFQDYNSKKTGQLFNYKYYNGERFTLKAVVINGAKFTKLEFVSMLGSAVKNTKFTVYLNSNLNQPIFYPSIENKFKARVVKIEAVTPGSYDKMIIATKFVKLKNHEAFNFMSLLRNRI